MREDTRGFNAMRRERHGETFPTQDVISTHLSTRVAEGGETVTLGGTRMQFVEMGVSAAETEKIVLDLDARYPFCEGVAGRARQSDSGL